MYFLETKIVYYVKSVMFNTDTMFSSKAEAHTALPSAVPVVRSTVIADPAGLPVALSPPCLSSAP